MTPLPSQRPNTEHFVLAERFKSRGGDNGDGNGLTHSIEDRAGEALRIIRSNVTVH